MLSQGPERRIYRSKPSEEAKSGVCGAGNNRVYSSNATQVNGRMMTRAPRRRSRGWRLDELTVLASFVRSAIRELARCLLSSTAAPRVCASECLVLLTLYCTVHTLCTQAHHSEPPLCHCDAESKATPTCDNTTQQHKSLAGRIRHRTRSAASRTCAFLEAHREYLTAKVEGVSGVATTGPAHCLPPASGATSQGVA